MITKSKKTIKRKSKGNATDEVKDYGNDPFFVKKAKESKQFLVRHGFPKDLALKK